MGRVMALDVGEATVGVAVSDPLGMTAQPICTIRRKNLKKDLAAIAGLVSSYEATCLVVGLPLTLRGERGPAAESVGAFVGKLKEFIRLPVTSWDERLSSVQAERALLEGDVSRSKRRSAIHQVAAAIVLQSYLDSRNRKQQ